ncbi:MAG: cytochrome c, partial [Anaerolineae bacterium]|nr:cytochrome c [Anaerolineae bacterium]
VPSPPPPPPIDYGRLPLFAVAVAALMVGLWGGMLLMGFNISRLQSDLVEAHGLLMVSGFLGLIWSLDRACWFSRLIERRWLRYFPYLAPIFIALGTLSVISDVPNGAVFMGMGSLFFVAAYGYMLVRRYVREITDWMMAGGAVALFLGNVGWQLNEPLAELVPYWMAFLLLTLIPHVNWQVAYAKAPTLSKDWFVVVFPTLACGAFLGSFNADYGLRLFAIGEILLAAWLFRYEAYEHRQFYRQRLVGIGDLRILSSYVWLAVSALLILWPGDATSGLRYDAALHALFLGFTMSLMFAYTPALFVRILNIRDERIMIGFGGHWLLLNVALALYIMGDLLSNATLRRWGGGLNALMFMLYIFTLMWFVIGQIRANPPAINRMFPIPTVVIALILVLVGFYMRGRADENNNTETPSSSAVSENTPIPFGEIAYLAYCSDCHGLVGQGVPGKGTDLVASEFVRGSSDADLRDFIIQGRVAGDAANTTGIEMPARGGHPLLSDNDIEAIVVYLRLLQNQ